MRPLVLSLNELRLFENNPKLEQAYQTWLKDNPGMCRKRYLMRLRHLVEIAVAA